MGNGEHVGGLTNRPKLAIRTLSGARVLEDCERMRAATVRLAKNKYRTPLEMAEAGLYTDVLRLSTKMSGEKMNLFSETTGAHHYGGP